MDILREAGEYIGSMTTTHLACLDPEMVEPLQGFLAAIGGGFDLGALDATRSTLNGIVAMVNAAAPPVEGVEAADRTIPGPPGGPDVAVRCYRPAGRGEALPALVWMHGGGFVVGSVEFDDLGCRQLAKDLEIAIVSVNYRLAPEHPYPAAIDDCYAALRWAIGEPAALGIDPERVAVGGASAGGALAASLALLARDRGEVSPCFQLLIYPSIDDRNVAQASATVPETLFWSRANALRAWQLYLGSRYGSPDVPAYAAAARATDLAGLPPAYISIGALDPFLGDCVRYTERLNESGTPAELHVYPSACHAFDVFAPMSETARRFVGDRNDALRRLLTRDPASSHSR